ncbi:MAG: FAD-dependent oxidoreductase [Sedimentisphaerales bacterium]
MANPKILKVNNNDDAGSLDSNFAYGSPIKAETFVEEPPRHIPVLYDVDVAVCGGGVSGVMAALAAARHGASTIIIDRFGRLGGNIGPGLWIGGTLHLALKSSQGPEDYDAYISKVGLGGLPEEFIKRVTFARPGAEKLSSDVIDDLNFKHYNVPGYRLGYGMSQRSDRLGYFVDSLLCSRVLDQMMEESGVKQLLSAYVTDPIVENNVVKGIMAETKSGRIAIKAKVIIDATGEADVCARAGIAIRQLNPNPGLLCACGGIDWHKYETQNGTALYTAVCNGDQKFVLPRKFDNYQLVVSALSRFAEADLGGWRTGTEGTVDITDPIVLTMLERRHRELAWDFAECLQRTVPGFENAYLMIVGEYFHGRGGRFSDCEYRITIDDVKLQKRFDDVVFVYRDDKMPNDVDIPYRSFIPKKLDGLLVCGRSGIVYGPNIRARNSILLHGQAAGVAAALSVQQCVQPRVLNVRKLQSTLLAMRCPLGSDERLRELGLRK